MSSADSAHNIVTFQITALRTAHATAWNASEDAPRALGSSCACWPDDTACGLDRDRQFDIFFVAGMSPRQLFHLQNVNAEIADFAQTQPGELRDRFADPAKHIVD